MYNSPMATRNLFPAPIPTDDPLLARRFRAPGYQDATLADLVALLRAAGDPLGILLFGSQARGDARATSDIDLLVMVPHRRWTRKVWARFSHAVHRSPVPCDVLITSPKTLAAAADLPGFIEHEALRDGICLYRRPRRHAANAARLLAYRRASGGHAKTS